MITKHQTPRLFYRKATMDDVNQIYALAQQQMDEIVKKSWVREPFDWESWLSDLIFAIKDQKIQRVMIVSVEEDPFVGFFWYNISGYRTLWLTSLVLSPQWVGKGIGTQIMRYLEEVAITEKCRVIELGVQEINYPAVSFYKKLGFQKYGYVNYAKTLLLRKKIKRE